MPTQPVIHVNDSGVLFQITVTDENNIIINLATIQSATLVLMNPIGATSAVACGVVGGGSTGVIQYTTNSTDLNQAGKWQMQVVVRFADNTIRRSTIQTFTVSSNLLF